MDITTVLHLIKARLGISSAARDVYITNIIESIIKELEDEKGLALDGANPYHLMFLVDFATWRYQNRDTELSMPRHLQYRLHNLIIHLGGGANDI